MSVLRAKNVTFRHGNGPVVLREVSLRIEPRDRLVLLGANGSGKTTLLRLLAGELEPTEGTVEADADLSVATFTQFSDVPDDRSAMDLLEEVAARHIALDDELATIESTLGQPGADDDALLDRQQVVLAEMEHSGGWDVRRRIDTVLSRLGFDEEHRNRPAAQLSSGWRNRAALARLLMDPPDLTLFDEPTNYLDIAGVTWLEGWLRTLPGAAVIASHDRHFLDQVATRIVDLTAAGLDEYSGSFSDYVTQRELRQKSIEKRSKTEAELWVLEAAAIADRKEAQRNPSQFLRRRMANIKKGATPPAVDQVLTGLYSRMQIGERLGGTENVTVERAGHVLVRGLDLEVTRGDRVGIVGPNGCGKSTLLSVLIGDTEPASGRVIRPAGVEWVSFEETWNQLDRNNTLTWAVNRAPMVYTAPRKQVNRFLEMLRFSELDLKTRIGDLSGGQQARAALAMCLLSGASVLVMDEPTNHLDLMSTQVMERALVHFPGAVLVASHDRFFLDKVATRLLVFEGDRVVAVEGNWTTWQASIRTTT